MSTNCNYVLNVLPGHDHFVGEVLVSPWRWFESALPD